VAVVQNPPVLRWTTIAVMQDLRLRGFHLQSCAHYRAVLGAVG